MIKLQTNSGMSYSSSHTSPLCTVITNTGYHKSLKTIVSGTAT